MSGSRVVFALAVLLTVTGSKLYIEAKDPIVGRLDVRPGPSVQPLDTQSHLELLALRLGTSTLQDVENRLGAALRRQNPDAGDAETEERCYQVRSSAVLVFESGAASGWTRLDGFRLMKTSQAGPQYRDCSQISLSTEELQTAGGLRLGLTREKVYALLGPPTSSSGDTQTFIRHWRRQMTQREMKLERQVYGVAVSDGFHDVEDTIQVKFSRSGVVGIQVRHLQRGR